MFRLIKLAMYAMVGYVLYELYQGMTQQQGGRSMSRGRRGSEGSSGNALGGGESRAPLTGGGSGMTDTAADTDGGAMRHTVGRGVVSSNPTV